SGGNCVSSCTVDAPASRVLVKAYLENQTAPAWFLVDTGASVVILDQALFNSLAPDPNRPLLQGKQLVGGSGAQSSFLARVGLLKVGGSGDPGPTIDLTSVEIGVIPGTPLFQSISKETGKTVQGLLGATYLRYFLTTVDYQKLMLRLSRYDRPNVDPNEFVGPGFSLQQFGPSWELVEVFTNKDAYAKGLRIGMVVEELGNQPISGQPWSVVQGIQSSYALGEEIPVTFIQSGNLMTVNVLVEDLLPTYPPPT